MAINKNHEFEELNGVKCAIVEKNASTERVAFLKSLLEFNKYTVISCSLSSTETRSRSSANRPDLQNNHSTIVEPPTPPLLKLLPIGVTDVTFNPTNAIFGRLLRTKDGHVVTLAYWNQQESTSRDEVPYYEAKLILFTKSLYTCAILISYLWAWTA
jgi:hypothetical protein